MPLQPMDLNNRIRQALRQQDGIRLAILFGSLASDPDAQDILTLNLTCAAQLCVDIGVQLITVQGKPAPGTIRNLKFDRSFGVNMFPYKNRVEI